MVRPGPRRTRPDFPRARAPLAPTATVQRKWPTIESSSLNFPHPVTQQKSQPCTDGCVDHGHSEAGPQGKAVLRIDEVAQSCRRPGRSSVVENASSEETILRRLRHQKACKRPLHCHERKHKYWSADEGDKQLVPVAESHPQEIKQDGRNNQQQRKQRWDEVRDRLIDRPQLGLCRKQRQNE